MSVVEIAAYVQKSAMHHPLMWRSAAVFLAITLLLGFMHDGKIAGEISIVLVRQFKHQAAELIEVGRRLKKELTTWDDSRDKQSPPKAEQSPREQHADGR